MMAPETSSAAFDRIGYLFGHPLTHSLSPLLHNTTFQNLCLPYSMTALDSVDIPDFLARMKDPRFFGSAVTMPHKIAIMPFLDEIAENGMEVGACNTIYLAERDGRRIYCGTNTDCVGIREAFLRNAPEIVYGGRPGVVVGGGGASRAAVYAMKKWMGCSPIYLVNRDKDEVDALVAHCKKMGYGNDIIFVQEPLQARELEGPRAITSCIPNFAPKLPNEAKAREVLEIFLAKKDKGAIVEMCYHPSPWTEIADISQRAGWKVILGTEPLIYQGLEQDRLWTLLEFDQLPVEKVKKAVSIALSKTQTE
jgi:quinate dehydrogenase